MAVDQWYPDDVLGEGFYVHEMQKARRLEELRNWFQAFQEWCLSQGLTISFPNIEGTAAIVTINEAYWELLEGGVRSKIKRTNPNAKVTVDRHKIASLMELLVVAHSPATFDGAAQCDIADLNARLAFFIAQTIIGGWNPTYKLDTYVSDSFDREHRTWLTYVDASAAIVPAFSNSATWYLVEKVAFERLGITST